MAVNPPALRMPARSWPAVAAVAVTVLLWGSSFVVIRAAGTDLSPGPMALLRMAVATAVLAPVALRAGVLRRVPRGRLLGLVLGYGVLWFAGYQLALNAAEQYIDAGTAALFVNVAPLLIALGAGVLLHEGLPRRLLVGGAVGLVGVTVMALGVSGAGLTGPGAAGGVVLALLAAVLYATSVLLQKVILRDLDGLTATWLGFVVGTVVLLPFAPALTDQLRTAAVPAVLGVVYLGVFSTALAFTTWAYALARIPAGRLGMVAYLVTVVSVVLSWLLLGEVPSATTTAGGVIALAGVALTRRRPARERVRVGGQRDGAAPLRAAP
ncbi:DMT family transporter [Georgenia sp. H159]|uniref:DMT family transporter n=1 Tax=Georgenia sp. H159 TaxID=3076115 RepID=UPI002D7A2DCF|nr:DMT family transporter [Georgenia sp. H159]